MISLLGVLCMLMAGGQTDDQTGVEPAVTVPRPVHTYSIVARDPETGEMGVAVQSHWFSVGSIVSWAEAGVGAVATQSLVDPSYGPLALEMLRAGRTPQEAMDGLTRADSAPEVRQVAIIDSHGNVASHTGDGCIPMAGYHVGDNYSVQANLMERNTVWDAMGKAFESAKGPLAERMLAALVAAEGERGDIRGKQSAAILVVAGEATGRPWEDRLVDLRIEDHADPLGEMERLLELHRAYEHMNAGDLAMETGDREAARREYGLAQELAPGNLEMSYWYAIALANSGEVEESLPVFQRIFSEDARWAELTPRLVDVNLLVVDQDGLARIMAQRP